LTLLRRRASIAAPLLPRTESLLTMSKSAVAIGTIALLTATLGTVTHALAEPAKSRTDANTLRLYKGQKFTGESYTVDRARPSLQLDMPVGSIAIFPGEKWEVCEKPRFRGSCNIIDADMTDLGAAAIQSARPIK
jgi:hypothetical protein